jgi:hypothetical protein
MIRKTCRGCIYHRQVGGSNRGEYICHYMIDTGRKRNSPADQCDKKKIQEVRREKRTGNTQTGSL